MLVLSLAESIILQVIECNIKQLCLVNNISKIYTIFCLICEKLNNYVLSLGAKHFFSVWRRLIILRTLAQNAKKKLNFKSDTPRIFKASDVIPKVNSISHQNFRHDDALRADHFRAYGKRTEGVCCEPELPFFQTDFGEYFITIVFYFDVCTSWNMKYT